MTVYGAGLFFGVFFFNSQNTWIWEPRGGSKFGSSKYYSYSLTQNMFASIPMMLCSWYLSIQRTRACIRTQAMVCQTKNWDFQKGIFSFWWHQTYGRKSYCLADWLILFMENSIGATQYMQEGRYMEFRTFLSHLLDTAISSDKGSWKITVLQ